jgi:acyl-CoA reductase-like NAD-dependent aldehyde dehydrogenase
MSATHLEIINPATEEIIASVQKDTADSVHQKLQQLQQGQLIWKNSSLDERIAIIKKYYELLERDIEILANTLTEEVGKPLQQSRNEVNGSRSRIAWMLDNAVRYLADETMSSSDNMQEIIKYEPLGVVCNISAWNYPYLVGTNVFIPALLAGNAVLYKPSEYATLTGQHIAILLKEAGVPADVFQLVVGDGEIGKLLLELPLDGYFFTGSYATGKSIYEAVAKKMVPCQCELGGKDPLYVADDVENIKAVAQGTADGAFYNNGQSCCSVERIYVHEKVFDTYVHEFVTEVDSWKMANPKEDGTYVGPLTRKAQIDFLEKQIKDADTKGAKILTGGKAVEGTGYYFQPTVLVDVDHSMQIMKEESFGPVIGIMKVKNDEEAIQLMNNTAYGLTASVYSADQKRAENILSQIDSGTGYWNCCDRVSAALPWSGRKHSGFGSTLSQVGFRAFTQPKAYHLRSK